MKVPLLRSRTHRFGQLEIRPARNQDWLAIERLLSQADRQYLALEWWTVQEWLGRPAFLLATDVQERAIGLILTVLGDGPIAWLRAISVASDRSVAPLLEASVQAVHRQGGTGIAFLGNERWILSKLRSVGFRRVNQVVTLRQRGRRLTHHGRMGLQVRTATETDIETILAVDHAAFSPMWWYGRDILERASNLACCFEAAYLKDECVGYQLSTLRNKHGHIVRLAVHPDWQRRGIGGRLLSSALRALDDAGAESVTVNTQEDNLASLRLYGRFAFERVGQPWAVWFLPLEQE